MDTEIEKQKPVLIYKKICDIMADVKVIVKNRKNVQQNYQFRGIDDVYNELHDLLVRHRVFTVPTILNSESEERKSKSGGTLIYRILTMEYKFFADDGSYISTTVIGEGMDTGDKASNKAMSVAHKYALIQIFAIPTDEQKDPENDSPEIVEETEEDDKKKKTYVKKDPKLKEYWNHAIDGLNKMLKMKMITKDIFTTQMADLKLIYDKNDATKMYEKYMDLRGLYKIKTVKEELKSQSVNIEDSEDKFEDDIPGTDSEELDIF